MSSSLRLELTTPDNDERPVYVSGNFCDWLPDIDVFQMTPVGPGQFIYEFPGDLPLPDQLEYKYTRGGWDHVELDAFGGPVPNRTALRTNDVRREYVPHWRWFGGPFNPAYLPRIELLGDTFKVPTIDRFRRVHALLPHDYDESDKRYPVLYLHDGQNLFGGGAGYGSWEIDQKMAILAARHHHEVILISIDHANDERIREFTFHRTRAGNGRGQFYLDFIRHTLKPIVDRSFRTLPDTANTGIGGSSLGGLISLYAGLMHPNVFGRLMIFSPALWISPKIYFDAIRFQAPVPMKIYAYGGEQESKYMVPNIQRFKDSLIRQQYVGNPINLHLSVDPEGTHQEVHWSREFPKAIEWLFY
ncbi:carbohydrate esterase [Spirosoma sp. BT702]|uniref:Carbohydrate esterase n=1 Tax=Spirosoma profusum TaxID=2771354 RepID=A0A926XZ85_9BACT|nr:alpha/beta hydrolase-fold protein [Spirosoma profusum]MBD2699005.1 carbohydrate esterase [Spirosoma profusum]